jgi:hypothetical protein
MNKLMMFPMFIYAILYIFNVLLISSSQSPIDPATIALLVGSAVAAAIAIGVIPIIKGSTGVSALTLTVAESALLASLAAGTSNLFVDAGVLGWVFGAVFGLMYGIGVLQQLQGLGGGGD